MPRKSPRSPRSALSLSIGALCAAGLVTLAGCGGGGGGSTAASPATPSTTTLSGVAATGAPIPAAQVVLTDATGATRSGTTGTDGSYTFDITGLAAPFVIKVSGTVGDKTVNLVSVQDTTPTAGSTLTVNVTPLTHAIAAALAPSGDPQTLDPVADKSVITANLPKVKTYVAASLQDVLTSAGVANAAGFDPVNTRFSADHSGADKAIDNLVVQTQPDGSTTLANKNGTPVNDLAEGASGSSVVASVVKLTPVAGNQTNYSATPPKVDSNTLDGSVVDAAVAAFNACFAVPAAQRGTVTANTVASACLNIVAGAYLNDGRNAAQEFDRLLSDSGMDNARFAAPEIIRFYDGNTAQVRLSWMRSDGYPGALGTVAKNLGTATAPAWRLYGNQRNYRFFVNGVAEKRDELNTAGGGVSAYTSGINLYFDTTVGNGATVTYVKVTGPGLGSNGVILKPSTGACSYLNITSNTGNASAAPINKCASYYRLTAVAQDATKTFGGFGGTNPAFAPAAVPDATLAAIEPLAAYRFEIHDSANGVKTYVERLRARPLQTQELPKLHYNVLSAATARLLDPASSTAFAGGTSLDVGWTPQADTAPVNALNVQLRTDRNTALIAANPQVPPGRTFDSTGTLRASATVSVAAPSGTSFPAATAVNVANGGFNYVSLNARTADDLQIFASTQYGQ